MSDEYWILLVFIACIVALNAISVFRARHMENMSNYVLGGLGVTVLPLRGCH